MLSFSRFVIADPAGSEVKFDAQGDGLARYTIMNYRRIPNSSVYDYKVRVELFYDWVIKRLNFKDYFIFFFLDLIDIY